MKRLLFLFCLSLSYSCIRAQDFQQEAFKIVDSLCEHTSLCLGDTKEEAEAVYRHVYDSVELALVSKHLSQRLADGEYSWPGWYFERRHWRYNDTSIGYPSKTGWYLLKHKYQIFEEGVSNGCIVQDAFAIYDSLMMREILKKWGEDFFTRYSTEVTRMDKQGKGLRLPFIKQGSTTKVLYQRFAYADTAKPLLGDYKPPLYLIIEFSGDTVKNADWGENFLGVIQFATKRFNPEEKLTEKVRALRWQGPRFDNKPADATLVFDFEKKELRFR